MNVRLIQKNGEIVNAGGDLEGIKITVISAGNNGLNNWEACQEELLSLSEDNKYIYLEKSGHFIQYDYPEVIKY